MLSGGPGMTRSAQQTAAALLPPAPQPSRDAPQLPSDATASPAQPVVRIHILGSMRATTCLGDEVLPRGRKARALLGCLCLAGGERLRRRTRALLMWDVVPVDPDNAIVHQSCHSLVVDYCLM